MRAFKLSSRGGRMVVGGAMLCTLGATATWLYCRTVLGLPMKLRMDGEGIWKWMTRTEALCERLKDAEIALAKNPSDPKLQFHVAAIKVALLKAEGKLVDKSSAAPPPAAVAAATTSEDRRLQ